MCCQIPSSRPYRHQLLAGLPHCPGRLLNLLCRGSHARLCLEAAAMPGIAAPVQQAAGWKPRRNRESETKTEDEVVEHPVGVQAHGDLFKCAASASSAPANANNTVTSYCHTCAHSHRLFRAHSPGGAAVPAVPQRTQAARHQGCAGPQRCSRHAAAQRPPHQQGQGSECEVCWDVSGVG